MPAARGVRSVAADDCELRIVDGVQLEDAPVEGGDGIVVEPNEQLLVAVGHRGVVLVRQATAALEGCDNVVLSCVVRLDDGETS